MKKLVVSLAVLVSSLGFAQESDTLRPEDVTDLVQEFIETIKNDKSIKSGDYDAPFLVGLAKTIFTDSTTKYKYAERNPKIADMEIRVNGAENIDYETWLTEYVKVLDTSKYEIHYKIAYNDPWAEPGEETFTEIINAWDPVNKEGCTIYFEYYKGCLMSIINF
jgi:hypothetical protein